MRYLSILFVLLCIFGKAQEPAYVTAEDFYKYRVETKAKFAQIQDNLTKCHKVYKTGLGISFAGIGLGMLSAPLFLDGDTKLGTGFAVVGSIMAFCGSVTIMVSHKYIGRAGELLEAKKLYE